MLLLVGFFVLSSKGGITVLSEYRHLCPKYSKAPERKFNLASRQYQIAKLAGKMVWGNVWGKYCTATTYFIKHLIILSQPNDVIMSPGPLFNCHEPNGRNYIWQEPARPRWTKTKAKKITKGQMNWLNLPSIIMTVLYFIVSNTCPRAHL